MSQSNPESNLFDNIKTRNHEPDSKVFFSDGDFIEIQLKKKKLVDD